MTVLTLYAWVCITTSFIVGFFAGPQTGDWRFQSHASRMSEGVNDRA